MKNFITTKYLNNFSAKYILGFAVLALGLALFIIPKPISAAYEPGNIISDSEFRASGSMNASQIQTFLQSKGSYLANPDSAFLNS